MAIHEKAKKPDGGPAYPSITTRRIEGTVDPNGKFFPYIKSQNYATEIREVQEQYSGMTLRDYFAAHASENDVYRHRFENSDGTERENELTVEQAKWAYADAMLAERDK